MQHDEVIWQASPMWRRLQLDPGGWCHCRGSPPCQFKLARVLFRVMLASQTDARTGKYLLIPAAISRCRSWGTCTAAFGRKRSSKISAATSTTSRGCATAAPARLQTAAMPPSSRRMARGCFFSSSIPNVQTPTSDICAPPRALPACLRHRTVHNISFSKEPRLSSNARGKLRFYFALPTSPAPPLQAFAI